MRSERCREHEIVSTERVGRYPDGEIAVLEVAEIKRGWGREEEEEEEEKTCGGALRGSGLYDRFYRKF